jgi:hypothetical protein
MDSDLKMTCALIIPSIVFLLALVISSTYGEKLKNECKLSGIGKGYSAVEIQAICDHK